MEMGVIGPARVLSPPEGGCAAAEDADGEVTSSLLALPHGGRRFSTPTSTLAETSGEICPGGWRGQLSGVTVRSL